MIMPRILSLPNYTRLISVHALPDNLIILLSTQWFTGLCIYTMNLVKLMTPAVHSVELIA